MNKTKTREEMLRGLGGMCLDLLVIGGGIVGSGVARDAAMRGLNVGLVDRYDFAFGTSSRSSRLLHGGLRYLEQGRVGLVHEASVEKKVIHDIAPHLAQPLPFLFPVYKGKGMARPMWQMRIGVKIYDLLCGGRNFAPSRGYSRKETLQRLPGLAQDKLSGAVSYYDALTNDARLVIDTLRSAVEHGAKIANYARFLDAKKDGDTWLCSIENTLSGERFDIRAKTIVNASGPWSEGIPHSHVHLRLSKGIHLVVDRKRLPVDEALVLMEGKRILFVIPWGERLIIGTTDTDYNDAPEKVRVEEEDIEYVLNTVNETFPDLHMEKKDIISSWAGLRPLVANPDGTPSDVSRAHEILSKEKGWWDITGGKLTTYRLMAEQACDKVMRYLKKKRVPCRTDEEYILTKEECTYSGLVPPPPSKEAVQHFIQNEWTFSLEDLMIRRAGWHYYQKDCQAVTLQALEWMSDILGWDETKQRKELEKYTDNMSAEYSTDRDRSLLCEKTV